MTTNAIIIMDGFGLRESKQGNAIANANMPYVNSLLAKYPHTTIEASGLSVGLPSGQMGNSEVGHLNLGAGRVVYQDITRIDRAITTGEFFDNEAFKAAMSSAKAGGKALHLIGLCSDGGVHSHIQHLYALLKMAKNEGVKKVYIHCVTDGRDVPPDSAREYVRQVESAAKRIGVGKVATVVGRYYYMDRDNRWERVQIGYNCVFGAEGVKYTNADAGIAASYAVGKFDEFIQPIIVGGYAGVQEGDSMIFYNFRSDRAREISRAIITPDFNLFERKGGYKKIFYVGMTQYDVNFTGIQTAFGARDIVNTLGEWLGKNGKTQARIAETEKYAHVTFFFNGGVEEANTGEIRVLVPSPKVATYDLQPQMSAPEVTNKALETIGTVDVIILNFANCDMVGHTGVFNAAVKAVEAVDASVKAVVEKILECGGTALVTADHGNAEQMSFDDGAPCTSHTTNVVPFIVAGNDYIGAQLATGKALCDVAPTLLKVMGLKQPDEMEGESIIK